MPTSRFLSLHVPGHPLLMPNVWDLGSARIAASLGFQALATTSSGFAATLGRRDGGVTREEAIEHAGAIAAAVKVPVSADLENGFADEPAGVGATVSIAADAGLAGLSIEDWSGSEIYSLGHAVERVGAAAESAHAGDRAVVLTARAENHIRGVDDLDDTIARLLAFAQAGADVVFAPGIVSADQIRAVVSAVSVPVSVLAVPGAPDVAGMGALGVSRISVGGALAFNAYGSLVAAGTELLQRGTYGYWDGYRAGAAAAKQAFTSALGV